jgi:hypothetical protein
MSGEIPVLINALVKAFCAPSNSSREESEFVIRQSRSGKNKASAAVSEKSGKK